MLKAYLQLLRIPGIFTAISNVVMGFMISQAPLQNQIMLIPLMISSGLLYLSGMVLNDYFDYGIDKAQRSSRPLPSGKISRRSALFLGVTFMSCANLAVLSVGTQTIILSAIISTLILLYNIGLKSIAAIGVPILCAIRILNVLLGTTAVEFDSNFVLVTIPLVFLIASLSVLGRIEIEVIRSKVLITSMILISLSIVSTLIIILSENNNHSYIVFLLLFIALNIYSSVKFIQKNSKSTQNKITHQLLSIIFLDATFVAAFSDLIYALMIAVLFIPAYLLTKRIYVT